MAYHGNDTTSLERVISKLQARITRLERITSKRMLPTGWSCEQRDDALIIISPKGEELTL